MKEEVLHSLRILQSEQLRLNVSSDQSWCSEQFSSWSEWKTEEEQQKKVQEEEGVSRRQRKNSNKKKKRKMHKKRKEKEWNQRVEGKEATEEQEEN